MQCTREGVNKGKYVKSKSFFIENQKKKFKNPFSLLVTPHHLVTITVLVVDVATTVVVSQPTVVVSIVPCLVVLVVMRHLDILGNLRHLDILGNFLTDPRKMETTILILPVNVEDVLQVVVVQQLYPKSKSWKIQMQSMSDETNYSSVCFGRGTALHLTHERV